MLSGHNKDLFLLIKLKRHEEKLYRGEGQRTHTVAFAKFSKRRINFELERAALLHQVGDCRAQTLGGTSVSLLLRFA